MQTVLPPESEIRDRVLKEFEKNPRAMTPSIARTLGIGEVHVIRHMPNGKSRELDIKRWEELIRSFEDLGKVHVIVNTGVVVLECFGQFGNFSTMGEWFNVQTSTIDMHIRHVELHNVFAVEKPGHMDGVNTLSFQFFNREGQTAFKVFLTFGGDAPPAPKIEQFKTLTEKFLLKQD